MDDWLIFRGTGEPHDNIDRLPSPPPWRTFDGGPLTPFDREASGGRRMRQLARAATYQADERTVELVNTALYLRRPLLVTGDPGTGKSTLAYAVAHELRLGSVLRWPVTSRSTLRDGLYRYDAVGRIEEAGIAKGSSPISDSGDVGRYLRLGPLGTALSPFELPRVLLVDEIDKSDIDLPNDLLDVFEEGEYEIQELSRIADSVLRVKVRPGDEGEKVTVEQGYVRCRAFPFVILTSNGERDFPPAFLRRCVRLALTPPDHDQLTAIVQAHLGEDVASDGAELVDSFLARRELGELATDQLLNAVYLRRNTPDGPHHDREQLADMVLQHLTIMG